MSTTPSPAVVERTEKRRVLELLSEGKRVDGRDFLTHRPIEVKTGVVEKAHSSATASIGNTKVLATVKIEFGVPYPDLPEEGLLTVNADLIPFASPSFEFGPPSEEAIELARVIDRIVRGSKTIDLSKLCIIPGEKAYAVYIDLYVLSHDGNLIDASSLAVLKALLQARKPLYRIVKGKVIPKEEYADLKIENLPVSITFAQMEGKLLVDPTLLEEHVLRSGITIAIDKEGRICAIQKSGIKAMAPNLIRKAVEIAREKAGKLREIVVG